MPEDVIVTYASSAHPGSTTWQWVYGRAFVRAFSVCILPIMIGALVTVLQGYPALLYLAIGLPVAVVTAALWTLFRMQATIVAVYVRPGAAAVQSTWDYLHSRPLQWVPIFELRTSKETLTVALGDTTYELERASWPEADALLDALKAARFAA